MAQNAKCRVCGKEYTPCKSAKYDPRVFNWREVACTPKCGQTYLEQIIASRQPAEEPKPKPKKVVRKKPIEVETEEANADLNTIE